MTDRHSGYLVSLGHDIREDDAEAILNAIRMIKGVVAVEPIKSSFEQQIAEHRRDDAWRTALLTVIKEGPA